MSYQLETNTDSSKIIHLNTNDADTYLQSGITTYCSFNLDTPIIIDKQHSALVSLNSAIIPYSMYNIRFGVNDKIPYRVVSTGALFYMELDEGNYTITSLASALKVLLDGLVHTSQSWTISFKRLSMKYTFSCGVKEIYFDFSSRTDTAHIELGFNKNEVTPVTGIGVGTGNELISSNVADVNGSIHSLFIRTNLTSKSSIDSQTKSFSTILGKIPIDTNFGGVLFYNPRDNTQKILIDTHIINIITIRITDEFNRVVDLNGLNCNMSILVDVVNKSDFIQKDTRRIKEQHIQFLEDSIPEKTNKVGRPRKVGRPKIKN
tara:strand:- start:672 stop:1628 length:957 start_codon:yes stop_codon:yes gene_type:complete